MKVLQTVSHCFLEGLQQISTCADGVVLWCGYKYLALYGRKHRDALMNIVQRR